MVGTAPDEHSERLTRTQAGGLFGLVLLMWFFGVMAAFLWVVGPSLTFFGAEVTVAQVAESNSRAVVARFVALGLGLGLIALAAWLRRFVWAGVCAVVALATAALFAAMGPADESAPSAPHRDHPPCYSGSNDCPGG